MSPLDRELADALRARAHQLAPTTDPLPGIHRRARRIQRRRRAATALGTAAVAGLLVAGVGLVGGGELDGDRVVVPAAPSPSVTEPAPSPSPSAPPPTQDGPALGLTARQPWEFRGDDAAATAIRDRGLTEWADAEGLARRNGTSATPLFATTVPEVGDTALLFLAEVPGEEPQLVLFTVTPEGDSNLDARPLVEGTVVVTRVLAGGEVPWVLVLASPAVGQVEYLPDGETPAEPVQSGPGWGVYERRVGPEVPDLARVYDGDGRVVLTEPLQLGCAEGQCGREPVVELGETAVPSS